MARGFSPQARIAEEKAKRGAAEVAEGDAEKRFLIRKLEGRKRGRDEAC